MIMASKAPLLWENIAPPGRRRRPSSEHQGWSPAPHYSCTQPSSFLRHHIGTQEHNIVGLLSRRMQGRRSVATFHALTRFVYQVRDSGSLRLAAPPSRRARLADPSSPPGVRLNCCTACSPPRRADPPVRATNSCRAIAQKFAGSLSLFHKVPDHTPPPNIDAPVSTRTRTLDGEAPDPLRRQVRRHDGGVPARPSPAGRIHFVAGTAEHLSRRERFGSPRRNENSSQVISDVPADVGPIAHD